MPSRTNNGATRSATRTWCWATSSRIAGVRRSRRGRTDGVSISGPGTAPSLTLAPDGALFVDRPRTSVLGVSVHAWFSNDELSLAPGDTLTLPLTVHNLGDETESYTIVPAGLTASWTTSRPATSPCSAVRRT